MNTIIIYSSLLLLDGFGYYKLQNNNLNIKNKSELIFILITKLFGIVIPIISYFHPKLKKYNFDNSKSKYVGIIFMLIVFILLIHIHNKLSKMYSMELKMNKNHKLITDGIYKFIRHPTYLCSLLFLIGQQMILPNKIGIISSIISYSMLLFIRIPKEEKMLIEYFGDEYKNYMKNTKKIIAYIY